MKKYLISLISLILLISLLCLNKKEKEISVTAAVPLIISRGTGAELRQPLGVVIAGGLCLSQLLTIFTTPVIYLYINKLRQCVADKRKKKSDNI